MEKRKRALFWITLSMVLGGLLVAGTAASMVQAQGGMITGRVTSPGGYPLPAGTLVKLFEPGKWDVFGQAAADVNDGTFSLGPVPNGLYVIKAVPPAGSAYTQSEIEMVSILNNSADVGDLALTTPQIIGAVVAPDGTTPTDAWVKVYAGDGTLLQGMTAESGSFLVGGLTPGGYYLVASPRGDEPYWDSAPETVTIAGTASIPVTLTLTMGDIYGVVQDELGHPIPLATVYAVEEGPGHDTHTDLSSINGHFAIGVLEPGQYVLGAVAPWNLGGLVPPRPITVTLASSTWKAAISP